MPAHCKATCVPAVPCCPAASDLRPWHSMHGKSELESCMVSLCHAMPEHGSAPDSSFHHAQLSHNSCLAAAEGKWSEPYLYIRGQTPRPCKGFVTKKDRASFTVAVFVRWGHRTVVVPIEDEASEGGSGKGSKRTTSPEMTAARFERIVEENLLRGRSESGGRVVATRRLTLKLCLDRDPSHTAKRTVAFLAQHGVEVLVLPTKAPDLDPLDYGVFNNVKHAWQRVVQRDRPGWEEQKSLLVRLLNEFNADAAIKQLPSRIHECIKAKGSWFEK